MSDHRNWRLLPVLAVAGTLLAPATGSGFIQSTATLGELPLNLNGAWFVVQQIEFPAPGPTPAPAAAAAGAQGSVEPSPALATPAPGAPKESAARPAPATSPGAGPAGSRFVTAINLFQIRHWPKVEAQKIRDAEQRMQDASIAKADALLGEERKKSVPMQSESGEVEGAPKVIVPSIPRRPDDATDRFDESEIVLQDVAFPKPIDEALQKANKAQVPWEPTAKDVALLKSAWRKLAPVAKSEYGRGEWKVYGPEHMDEGLQQDEQTRDAKVVISGTLQLMPRPGQPDKLILIYGVRELKEDVLSGGHVRAIMTTAPFPIPIDMKGRFTMYRLGDVPQQAAASAAKPAAAKTPAGKRVAK